MTLPKENNNPDLEMPPLPLEDNMVSENEAEDPPTTVTSRIQRQDKKV